MLKNTNKSKNYPPSGIGLINPQSGVALIVVLFILILIMVIGAVAIRSSTTDLKVSTAAQVNKLLFQANDAAFMKVEKEDRILSTRRGRIDTLKGYMSSPQRLGHEVNFCVRPRSDRLFSITEMSERNADGNLLAGSNNKGYCDPSEPNDFVSEGRVITQMTFVRPQDNDDGRVFNREVVGTFSGDFTKPENTGSSPIECTKFVGYVTSIIPSLSTATSSQILNCLKKPRTGSDTVDACLIDLDVPFQTQQQIYVNQPLGVECIS